MLTHSGVAFYPLDPRPEEILLKDIAWGLSQTCRYAGQCKFPYSVAQHSVLCAMIAEQLYPGNEELILWALLHDATEAYISDIPRPLKKFLPDYIKIEDELMAKIAHKFHLGSCMPPEIKQIDNGILADEFAQIMPVSPIPVNLGEPYGLKINEIKPIEAYKLFISTFERISSF